MTNRYRLRKLAAQTRTPEHNAVRKELQAVRTRVRKLRREVDAQFTSHLNKEGNPKGQASSGCWKCNQFWAAQAALDAAVDAFRKPTPQKPRCQIVLPVV